MDKPTKRLARGRDLDASIAPARLATEVGPKPSKASTARSQRYRCRPRQRAVPPCKTVPPCARRGPRCPSPRGTQSGLCAAPAGPGSRHLCSRCPLRPPGVAGARRRPGSWTGRTRAPGPLGARGRTGPRTSGMTSPARRTTTVSPGLTSLALTWSSLCNVARLTRAPPTTTGSRTANGVALPVRPMDTMMSLRSVVRSSGGNL